jgi:hypothetical protein
MNQRPSCDCFDQYDEATVSEVFFHPERQDTACDGWQHLLELIEQAATDRRAEFAPMSELSWEERSQIVTLPPTIAKLTSVRHLLLYGSYLVRIPPEIGAMTNLEVFTPYTSHRLHWFPYEITRCKQLKQSTVSTRSLYGNYKLRPPFPKLQPGQPSIRNLRFEDSEPGIWGAEAVRNCSVCSRSLEDTGLYQVWISLVVATDVLPLLVNACSEACIQRLPQPPDGCIPGSHTGGLDVRQPPAEY